MDSYKRAMDKVTADDEFRAKLLNKLESEQKKSKQHHTHKPKKIYPLAAAVASAAVLLFTITFSRAYLLPLLRYNAYDGEGAKTNNPITLLPWFDKSGTEDKNATTDNSEQLTQNESSGGTQGTVTKKPEPTVENEPDKKVPDTDVTFEELYNPSDFFEPPSMNAYKIVSYPGYDKENNPETPYTITYDMVIHLNFVGFEKYDIGLYRNDMIFSETLDSTYSLSDFFYDYSDAITSDSVGTRIDEGILQSFLGVRSYYNDKQIRVYIDDKEVLNLETSPMSQFKDMTDVYLTVSVV